MLDPSHIPIGAVLRQIRLAHGLTQVTLAKQSGIDPRTITAIEKGRILNPSLINLKRLTQALGITLRDLFGRLEAEESSSLWVGNQSGEFEIDLPHQHARLISYLPPNMPFGAGKLILGSKGKIDPTTFPLVGTLFLQVVLGKMELNLEGREILLREGQNCFFNGRLRYTLSNPVWRAATALLFCATPFHKEEGIRKNTTAS